MMTAADYLISTAGLISLVLVIEFFVWLFDEFERGDGDDDDE